MMRRIRVSKLGLRLLIGLAVLAIMLAIVPLVGAALADPCVQGETPSGCADVKLHDPALVADFYIGETLAATGVNSARLNITPANSVKIEARNVRDGSPEFGDIYNYSNANTYAYINAGQVSAYTITPRKQFLKGFLALTCSVGNVQPDETVLCRPSIDGVVQPDIAPDVKTTYALLPGKHAIHIDLIGDQAVRWNKTVNDHNATITAGRTASVTSKFVKRGLLTINLSQPGVTADLYVDGTLIASQAAAAEVWVTSNTSHKVEARSVTDPAAAGVYKWKDAASNFSLIPGKQRTVTQKLTKEFLVGFLDFRCELDGYTSSDDVLCNVSANGTPLGSVSPLQNARYNLPKGVHELTVTLSGAAGSRWEQSKVYKVTIRNGQSTRSTARFKATPVEDSPGTPYTATITGFNKNNLRTVFQRGQSLGNQANRFSKIGDSESAADEYLSNFDTGNYALASYQSLSPVISYFSGSFIHEGHAVKVGMSISGLMDPLWANPNFCNANEHALACEIRTHKPAIALILLRTYEVQNGPNSDYHNALRSVVKYCLDRGVIPVLSTAPYWYPPLSEPVSMNNTIRLVATEYKVPLWDLWVTTEKLPDRGVGDQRGHTSIPPDRNASIFEGDYMNYGMTHRNLEALEVLHMILNQVIQP